MSDATPNNPVKKKRNLAGNPDPDAEVIALSPKTLMAKNRFLCEVCNKGFQRDQNLQLHRRGHNLPWKLKQRPSSKEAVRKKVYVCPEASCIHNHPSRALGDLTGIKKHFSRKHGEKKYGCDRCSKKYAVRCDWKAHCKTCGTREYKCDCGTIFSRRDSFVTHRAFCVALADESAKSIRANPTNVNVNPHPLLFSSNTLDSPCQFSNFMTSPECNNTDDHHGKTISLIKREQHFNVGQFHTSSLLPVIPSACNQMPPPVTASSPHLSATVLLHKAAEMGTTSISRPLATQMAPHTTSTSNLGVGVGPTATHSPLLQEVWMMSSDNSMEMTKNDGGLTRDFLGLEAFSHKDVLFTIDEYIDGTCMRSSFEE